MQYAGQIRAIHECSIPGRTNKGKQSASLQQLAEHLSVPASNQTGPNAVI
jgi:hypothetical protein